MGSSQARPLQNHISVSIEPFRGGLALKLQIVVLHTLHDLCGDMAHGVNFF